MVSRGSPERDGAPSALLQLVPSKQGGATKREKDKSKEPCISPWFESEREQREAFTVPSLTTCIGSKGQNLSRQVSRTARKPGHRASLCGVKAERQAERGSDEEHVGWLRLAPILFVHVCGTLGFSIALPILVFLVADFGGSAWVYGLLGATYSTAQSIGAPVLGRWSDRIGRRTVLLVSQGGTVAAWVLFLVALRLPREALAEVAGTTITLPLLAIFAARFLDGLTGGNISVANAYVADLTRKAKASRQLAFGRMGMAASLGFTAGPALAGLLGTGDDPYTLPIAAAIGVSVVGLVLCFRLREPAGRCPEGPPPETTLGRAITQQQRRCDRSQPESLGALRTSGGVRAALLATFTMFLAFNLFYAAFPVHATRAIGWSTQEMGVFYSSMSAAMFFTQGPLLQAVSRRASQRIVFLAGLTGLILAFLSFPGASSLTAFGGGLLFALGNGFAWPTFQARTAGLVPEDTQGRLQGALSSAGSLASIAGLVLGGLLYPWLGGQVFFLSSALFTAVLLLVPRLFAGQATS